jgi:hypothetical protein
MENDCAGYAGTAGLITFEIFSLQSSDMKKNSKSMMSTGLLISIGVRSKCEQKDLRVFGTPFLLRQRA